MSQSVLQTKPGGQGAGIREGGRGQGPASERGMIRATLAVPEDLDDDSSLGDEDDVDSDEPPDPVSHDRHNHTQHEDSDSRDQIPNGSQGSLPMTDGALIVGLPGTTVPSTDDADSYGHPHAKLFLKMVSRDSRRSSQSNNTGTGMDELDQVSLYSLYMDHDFRYFFQHPYMRLSIAYLVIFCNFLIYAEDPVAHSETECFIPVIGNCFSFIFTRYPRNAWALLKVIMWILAIIFGLIVGKLAFHKVLFNRLLRLKMFNEDEGSWMTMFFSVIFFLFLFSHIYNLLLLMGGADTLDYRITEYMGIRNSTFMKAAATGTWCGDLFTAWMVTDVMLQERLYPHWAPALRAWWNAGVRRIVLFWVTVGTTSAVFITVISTDWINWDEMNHDFIATNEVSRAFLASFILVMDLLIVMQDWDFPHFVNNFDVKLPGINKSVVKLHIPNIFQAEKFVIHITGKWFNYGILYIVMMLDLNMWKNQIFYTPPGYGQYFGPTNKLHTIRDDYSLLNLMNDTYFSYEWRSTNINPVTNMTYIEGDMVMNSKYLDYALGIKCIAFVPSLAAFICFGVLVWYFGRHKPSPTDPHGGRLKKRRKMYQRYSGKVTFRRSVSQVQNQKRITLKAMRVYTDGGPSVIFDGKEIKDYVLLESMENGKHVTIQETSVRPSYFKSTRVS